MDNKDRLIELLKSLVDIEAEAFRERVLSSDCCSDDYAGGNIDDAVSHGERLADGHASKIARQALALLGVET